ncbi:MAG: flagellar protein [Lachnospiraceae bacterium]|nr:flagellar protein [Lachnospiraceae bacterium]
MEVTNCRGCGRLFNYISGEHLCPDCKKKSEEKFKRVKEYVQENKNTTLEKIAEETETSLKLIKQWIREERLVFAKDSVAGIPCENCGKLIRSGRFCEDCKKKMASNIAQGLDKKPDPVQSKKKEDRSNKMRFLDM